MNIKKIFISLLIIISLFLTLIFIDNYLLTNKIFGKVSIFLISQLFNIFGVYSFLMFIFTLIITTIILIPVKLINKIFMITGILLLSLFLPAFNESYKFFNYYNGLLGINIANIFVNSEGIQNLFLYFFWFFTSLFFLLFPFKNKISESILTLFNSISAADIKKEKKDFKIKNYETKIKNNHNKIPWMSKVIFDSSNIKTEIPVIPKENLKIKQFVLTDQDEKTDYYKEIPQLEENKDENQIIENEKYFDKLKKEWPEKWKKNKGSKLLLPEPFESGIEEIDILNDQPITYDVNKLEKKIEINKLKLNIKKKPIGDSNYNFPESDILESAKRIDPSIFIAEHKESAKILEDTLLEFDIKADVSDIINGPVVTLFKLKPAPGIKLQKIESLSNNLALRLAAKSIRIIAPIPGEKVVGIEIPNRTRQLVKFKEIVNSEVFSESDHHIPIGLGKDINGNIIVIDLYKMPHLLIAGATGSGKSVCVNALIASILFSKTPEEVRLLFIDPKIVELKPYNDIPHLLTPVISEPKQAMKALKYLMMEMERRYILFDEMGVRDIVEYQIRKNKRQDNIENIPFIVTIVDEFADLMSTSGKEAEILFARLAAKARAVGIHLILATQRPSTDVITGLIKANIPARIAFQVISLMNSRIILDQKGAEKLLGQGDLLYISPVHPFPERLQGAFLTKEEVDLITEHWRNIAPPNYINIDDFIKEDENNNDMDYDESDEPLFEEALKIIYQTQKASASYLQRRLGIGYNRAARIIEEMEKQGIVGPQNGSKPRDIIKSNHDLFS